MLLSCSPSDTPAVGVEPLGAGSLGSVGPASPAGAVVAWQPFQLEQRQDPSSLSSAGLKVASIFRVGVGIRREPLCAVFAVT